MKKALILLLMICVFVSAGAVGTEISDEEISVIVYTDEKFNEEAFRAENLCEITGVFTEVIRGFSADTYIYNIEKIKEFEGVCGIYEDTCYTIFEPIEAEESFTFYSAGRGYLGEGALVAVVDSSFNVNHEVFRITDISTVKYTSSDIANILSSNTLQAETMSSSATASGVYKSAKIPFAFDYSSGDTDVYSSETHGNGVASVIGANSSRMKGVLPETQLALMKVGDDWGGMEISSIISAFEDAVILGVDAINLSIGSSAGFSSGELEGFEMGTLFENIRKRGIFISCACGNDNMLNAEGLSSVKFKDGNMPLCTTPDYGMLCAPATSDEAVAVAAYDPNTSRTAYYSSVGPNPDLTLKPDISATGTRYLATIGSYQTRSGTSFAAPELCAKSVIVSKTLEERGVKKSDLSYLTENFLMSSADIITDDNGIPVSPRYQGSGFADTDRAVSLKTILYGEDGKSKISLKDGLENSINFSFYAENTTDESLSYTPSIQVITDGYSGERISGKSIEIPHTANFGSEKITLSPNEKKKIDLEIEIDEKWAQTHKKVFSNGFYVEGYIIFESSEETANIPFMGFYGDWTDPPVFIPLSSENGFGFADRFSSAASPKNLFYLGNKYFESAINLKVNDYNKISFSPNKDGALDAAKLYPGLYRNAYKFRWEIRTASGSRVKSIGIMNFKKGMGINIFGNSLLSWDGKNASGQLMPDGLYYLYASAYLDFGEEVVSETVTYPLYLDTTPPVMEKFKIEEKNGREILSFDAVDGHYVQIGALSDTKGKVLYSDTNTEDGKYSFDITGYPRRIMAETADYGLNISGVILEWGNEYRAFFDDEGTLLRVEKSKGLTVDGKAAENYNNLTFEKDEEYAKIFIWDDKMNPIFNTIVYK